jgi:hypothetical protein
VLRSRNTSLARLSHAGEPSSSATDLTTTLRVLFPVTSYEKGKNLSLINFLAMKNIDVQFSKSHLTVDSQASISDHHPLVTRLLWKVTGIPPCKLVSARPARRKPTNSETELLLHSTAWQNYWQPLASAGLIDEVDSPSDVTEGGGGSPPPPLRGSPAAPGK